MAEVGWTPRALLQVNEAAEFIAQSDPAAGARLKARLVRLALLVGKSPGMGRPISRGRRQLSTVKPYLLRYRLQGDVVQILEIRHGARRPNA